ncbi:UDP-2,3-diacylglucosamine diphosphatase LpxI [Phaeovibrio sulfidiphilus]|uniref:UDP-2,3-diacylglucosamine diphosphatase LpxI n=1 Tax=Phaeovibrio sulfidiphilus TaxID=1220600 RepID=A0A8J6YWD7_9PROT|nr:UDP-2,3-diacylglucosamine diphosphatase LpxI [Phaeovibrio sulfidiphilus]MBE1236912.1 UDP-2,3-diacylglucosamine diphosphatase LpxI [Phaeovibrio sulfidiphilus]
MIRARTLQANTGAGAGAGAGCVSGPASGPATAPRPPLAIVAGGGDLPRRVMEACRRDGRDFLLVGIEGHADPQDWEATVPQMWIRLPRALSALDDLRTRGIATICLAGCVRRPSVAELLRLIPDRRTAAFLMRAARHALGDDSLLRAVVRELETEGFTIEASHEVIGSVLAPEGVLGSVAPDDVALRDLRFAFRLAKAMGELDVGQGAIVQQGIPLAVEAVEGTDAMLARAGDLAREGPGGVLVKTRKPGQDTRVDLPAVGVTTVVNARAAGLRGIGLEAGGTLVIDLDRMVRKADELGLFVVGLGPDDIGIGSDSVTDIDTGTTGGESNGND